MLVSCETDIKTIENRIQEMKDIENTVKERKKQMKKSVELLDGIIADGAISDTHLRMLVDEIVIYEKNGKLDIQITLRQARIIRTRFLSTDFSHCRVKILVALQKIRSSKNRRPKTSAIFVWIFMRRMR